VRGPPARVPPALGAIHQARGLLRQPRAPSWPAVNDDVTVVIACFNYGRYLPEAVESALPQAGPGVVGGDGSTDGEALRVVRERPAAVELIPRENQGVCAARNAGLARVRTAYALVLDADDRLPPDAIEVLRRPLEADATLGYTYGTM